MGAAILQQDGTQSCSLHVYNMSGEAMVSARLTNNTAPLELQILMSPTALRLQRRRRARLHSLLCRYQDCDAVPCIARKLVLPDSYKKFASSYSFRCLEIDLQTPPKSLESQLRRSDLASQLTHSFLAQRFGLLGFDMGHHSFMIRRQVDYLTTNATSL